MRDDLAQLIWLISLPGAGINQKRMLWDSFGDLKKIWTAGRRELMSAGAASERFVDSLMEDGARMQAEVRANRAIRDGVAVVGLDEADYPENLRKIYDPPLALFYRGEIPRECGMIAVIGSRKATSYGCKTAYEISAALTAYGICVVSGAARGIDTSAHNGALAANGLTVAVLGCGLNVVYPPENRLTLDKIAKSGAVVTEFLDDMPPFAYNFPMRNRIISGLSDGIVIVEASEKSGSLITVDHALEQGREVFAVPGNITSVNSAGTNRLIKDGAHMLTDASDVAVEIGSLKRKLSVTSPAPSLQDKRISAMDLTKEDMLVLKCISVEPEHMDSICIKTGLSPQKVSACLLDLLLKGIAEEFPGKIFSAGRK